MDDPEARSVLGMRIPVLVVVTSLVIGAVVAFVSYVTGRLSRQSDENGSGKQQSQDDKIDEADSAIEAGKTAAANGGGNGAATSGKRAKNKKRREAQHEFTHSWMVGALKGHTGPVLDMNFSSNGKFLASCAEDCDLTPEEEPEDDLKDIEGTSSTVANVTSSVTSSSSSSSSSSSIPTSTCSSGSKNSKVRPSVPSAPSAVTLTSVKDPQPHPPTLSRRQRKNRTRAPREQQRRLDDDADDDNPDFLPHHRPHHHRRSSPSRLRHRQLNSRHFHQESPTRDSTDSSASTTTTTTTTRTTSSSSPRTGSSRRAQGQGQSSPSSKVTSADPSLQGRVDSSTLKTLTLGTSAKVNGMVTPKVIAAGTGSHPGAAGKKSKNPSQGHHKVSSQRDELNHLSDAALASLLRRYTLTGMQLAHLGYPVECSYFPGCAVILNHQQHPQGHRAPRGHRPHNLDANAREFVPGKNTGGSEKSTWTTNPEVDSGNGSGSSLESSDLEPESASDSDKNSDIGESSSSSSSASSTSSSSSSSSSSASSTSSGYEKSRRSSQALEFWDQGHGVIERPCVRCHKSFYVTREDGKYVGDEKCRYHWGKLRNGHDRRQRDRWECCQGHEDAAGCTEAKAHVWTGLTPGYNGPFEGYTRTRPSRTVARDGNYGVFALDCEMCFTRRGLELAKVTLVGMDGEIVYDALVKPEDEVIDHNTRFSGITAGDLERATKTLRDVQKDITTFVHAETILIGHGLENDLRALRLLHTTVIDTCVAFPHFLGYPFRSSLKTLARTVLKKEIQVTEHDSVEDARIAVDLMLRRLQHDLY